VEPSHASYAGLVSRVLALGVDVVALTLGSLIVGGLPVLAWERVVNTSAPQWLQAATYVAAAILPWAYLTAFWWLTGQTLGDIVTGIQVQRIDGGDVSFWHAAIRAAGCLVLVPVWLVGMLAVLWDRRRMAWHDHVFRTTVRYINAAPQPGAARPPA
jgi:uncharacterized RDD family membrane protein YckC